jgi:protein-S-isoprenylcysteine O-methyltransferase Ste14
MENLELRIPPVAVFVLVTVAMRALAGVVPALSFDLPGKTFVAIGLAVAGLLIGIVGLVEFARARTTFHPNHPEKASALVTSGVYRFSRNPMYLGVLLVIAGWAVHLANIAAFFGLPVFVAYINRFQIAPEERVLRAKFGASFTAYERSVRRWL